VAFTYSAAPRASLRRRPQLADPPTLTAPKGLELAHILQRYICTRGLYADVQISTAALFIFPIAV